jgi:NAD(P)H-hydrate epimerase
MDESFLLLFFQKRSAFFSVRPNMTDPNLALLTNAECGEADRLTIAAGTSGITLMENAGTAVAAEIIRRWTVRSAVVLCGPGNNGGDGFVAARVLARAGWRVRLGLLGARDKLPADARHHAALWRDSVELVSPALLAGAGVVVDALFGAGLSRPVEGPAAETLRAAGDAGLPIVAIDVPSGVEGDTGADLGAVQAALTVTFFRKKPGHILLPGRTLSGELVVADIGINARVLDSIGPTIFENGPGLWRGALPRFSAGGNKFDRGHALLFGGPVITGAARMAARAAARAGAGLTTIATPERAWAVYAGALTSIMVQPLATPGDLAPLLADKRVTGMLIGPGAGINAETRAHVLAMLGTGRPVLLDADAISLFKEAPDDLFAAITGPCVMTPHEGEFRRIFRDAGDKLSRTRGAAARSGAVVVLKGSDTVVAAPDGRTVINTNAPDTLATAGSGDVLGGIILGLLTQGMEPFLAAAAGVWMHGAAAAAFGPGLLAEDLPDLLPGVRRGLQAGA